MQGANKMIKLANIDKQFKNGAQTIHAVNSLSLELPEYGLVVLLGKSGSGKSTLLNIIGGLDDYKGEITYDESTTISGYKPFVFDKYRAANIGYVFQDFYIDEDVSIIENIRRGLIISGITDKAEQRKRIDAALKAVGLILYKRRMASSLSLGQKQRVAIARAISIMPKILLADEPTGNLDSDNSSAIMEILKKLSQKMLVICVTHNENLANNYADVIYHIQDGKLDLKEVDKNTDVTHQGRDIEETTIKNYSSSIKNINVSLLSDDTSSPTTEIKIFVKDGKNYIYIPDDFQVTKVDLTSDFNKIKTSQKEMKRKRALSQVDTYDTSDFKDERKHVFFTPGFFKNSITKKQHRLTLVLSVFIAIALAIGSTVIGVLNQNYKQSFSSQYDPTTNVVLYKEGSDFSNEELKEIIFNPDNNINGVTNLTFTPVYLNNNICELFGSEDLSLSFINYQHMQDIKDDEVVISLDFALNLVDSTHPNAESLIGTTIAFYDEYGTLKNYSIKDIIDYSSNLLIVGGLNNYLDTFWFAYFNDSINNTQTKSQIAAKQGLVDLLLNLQIIEDSNVSTIKISQGILNYFLTYKNILNINNDSDNEEKAAFLQELYNNVTSEEEYRVYIPEEDTTYIGLFFDYLFDNAPTISNRKKDSVSVKDFNTISNVFNYPKIYINQAFLPNVKYLVDDYQPDQSFVLNDYHVIGTFTDSDAILIYEDEHYPVDLYIGSSVKTVTYRTLLGISTTYYIFMTDNLSKSISYYRDNNQIKASNTNILSQSIRDNNTPIYIVISIIIGIELLLYALLFRSKMATDLKMIGIYRSLGMRRNQIVMHYVINTLVTLTTQFLIPYLLMIVLIFVTTSLIAPASAIVLGALSGYLLVFIAILIPLAILLLKTPHKILTKYDI